MVEKQHVQVSPKGGMRWLRKQFSHSLQPGAFCVRLLARPPLLRTSQQCDIPVHVLLVSQITAMNFEADIHLSLGRCLHLRLLSSRLSADLVSGVQGSALPKGRTSSGANG